MAKAAPFATSRKAAMSAPPRPVRVGDIVKYWVDRTTVRPLLITSIAPEGVSGYLLTEPGDHLAATLKNLGVHPTKESPWVLLRGIVQGPEAGQYTR